MVNPKTIKPYMFGADAISELKEGSPIVWKGEWNGKGYENKGKVLQLVPERKIQYSHYSPLTGLPDAPENYHIVTIELSGKGTHTLVYLSQVNNPTHETLQHNTQGWKMMLDALKKYVEETE